VAGLSAACTAIVGPTAQAEEANGRPLTAGNFKQAAPRGFGDRNNSWAHSMAWWHGHLYVGTARAYLCVSDFAIWDAVAINFAVDFADAYLPYPPKDPDLSCTPDGADLPIQAEIWRWAPRDNTWTRVFQSPLAVNNPGPGGPKPAPPRVMWQGKKLPYEYSIRGLSPFTEPDGTEALYAFGVNTNIMWDGSKTPLPRILRSTDGVTFAPVPQTPGSFLGDLPFASDRSSYRSPTPYRDELFVLCGPVEGQGALIASADPAKGDNAWFLASPPGMQFYDIAVFNGWLYLGGFDLTNGTNNGYTVLKTRAEGTPPYQFFTVVPTGAYLTQMPSESVVSMHEYRGRLYVGTGAFTEVIRINTDDTWDLVVGAPRAVPMSNGGSEVKYPLSGLDAGFGHTPNDHAWQMEDFDGNLYIGTYNLSTSSRFGPTVGPLLLPHMGAHLYRSQDGGSYYSGVTTTGFAKPSDPYGGIFDYGIRTMASTPYGLFLGTANDYYGLGIFRATPSAVVARTAPAWVEMEPLKDGSALVSWKASPAAGRYQIWRAERNLILFRTGNIEEFNPTAGGDVPDVYVGAYKQIGETRDTVFVDSMVQPGQPYMYYVVTDARDGNGRNPKFPTTASVDVVDPATGAILGALNDLSDQSNLVAFPLLTPPVTFAQLLHEIDVLDRRRRFKNPNMQLTKVRNMIVNAQLLAMNCRIAAAVDKLDPQKAYSEVLEPDATDLEILIAKLVRRLQLFNRFRNEVISNEFCNQP
jgi:hypothetical protein